MNCNFDRTYTVRLKGKVNTQTAGCHYLACRRNEKCIDTKKDLFLIRILL